MELERKFQLFKDNLSCTESAAIAFSGGVDSTFLLKVAKDILGEKAVAITAASPIFPQRELLEAKKYAEELGVNQIIIPEANLDIEKFADNPINRCYICKKAIFANILGIAELNGIRTVFDGSNLDDTKDFRPGMKASMELGIVSPIKEAGLTKEDVRKLSFELGLSTWDKPSFACLCSRIPYGDEITLEKLSMLEKAEDFLLSMGLKQVRVRHHGEIARIEVLPTEIEKFFHMNVLETVEKALKEIGYTYVTLDISGYRTGSLNESKHI